MTTYTAFISYSRAVDEQFAPLLQRGLQRFAKPWYRRRALRVFRDQTSLSATPSLWSSIQAAMDASEFFVLLASPAAAKSPWVDQEVRYWMVHKPAHNLLIAITEGGVVWDRSTGDFDWGRTTALPEALRGQFDDEPNYVDFTWARQAEQLSLRHGVFRDRLAEIAAPLHHRGKDELIGEDIQQHRRTIGVATAAGTLVAVLGVLAAFMAIRATRSADEARAQRDRAEAQLRLATARYVATRSGAEGRTAYSRSLLLGLASLSLRPTAEGESALLTNLQRNPELKTFWRQPGPGSVTALDITADGRLVTSGAINDQVTVWDARSGTVKCRLFAEHGNNAADDGNVAMSSSGLIAAASQDSYIQFADARRCRELGRTAQADDLVSVMAFNPDGRMVASGGGSGDVRLWNARTRRLVRVLTAPKQTYVYSIAFSADRRTVAAGMSNKRIILWDARTGQRLGAPLEGHTAAVTAVAFSPRGHTLATADQDGRVLLWNLRGHREVARPARRQAMGVSALRFAPGGRTLAWATADGRITLWDVSRRRTARVLRGHADTAEALVFAPDGRRLLSGSRDASLVLWDLRAENRLATVRKADPYFISAATFAADSHTVALGAYDGVSQWDVRRKAPVGAVFGEPRGWVKSLAYGQGGRVLVAGTEHGIVHRFDARTGKAIGRPLRDHEGEVTTVAVDARGELMASGGKDGVVVVRDVQSGSLHGRYRPLETRGAEFDDIAGLAFSPGGDRLAGVGFVALFQWDTATERMLGEPLELGLGALYDVDYSSNGRRIAIAALDSADVRDAGDFKRVLGHMMSRNRAVLRVGMTRDSQTVAAVREDGSLALWSAVGTPIGGELRSPPTMGAAAISPDGRSAVVGLVDGRLVSWDLNPDSWQRIACAVVRTDLRADEWRATVGAAVPPRPLCQSTR